MLGKRLVFWFSLLLNCRMKVLRCQLPRKNEFYPENEKDFTGRYFDSKSSCSPFYHGINLCSVCGIRATAKCSKCNVYYCSRDHQVAAWQHGHKEHCGKGDQSLPSLYEDSRVYPQVQFPLWEVDIFPEPEPSKEELAAEEAERNRLNAFKVTEGPVSRLCHFHSYPYHH